MCVTVVIPADLDCGINMSGCGVWINCGLTNDQAAGVMAWRVECLCNLVLLTKKRKKCFYLCRY